MMKMVNMKCQKKVFGWGVSVSPSNLNEVRFGQVK